MKHFVCLLVIVSISISTHLGADNLLSAPNYGANKAYFGVPLRKDRMQLATGFAYIKMLGNLFISIFFHFNKAFTESENENKQKSITEIENFQN